MSRRMLSAATAAALSLAPLALPATAGAAVPQLVADPPGRSAPTGRVISGSGPEAKPLAGLRVRVYQTGDGRPELLGTDMTDRSGRFRIQLPTGSRAGVRYAIASRGPIQLAAVLPGDRRITVNELSTVAAAYAFAQFWSGPAAISGPTAALRTAAGMTRHLVSRTGRSGQVIRQSPNRDETNTWRATNTLANALAACVDGSCGALFRAAGGRPATTLEAISAIAAQPADHVQRVWRAAAGGPYAPVLRQRPDAWTLAVKFNRTGSEDCMFGGPGNIAFDPRGFAWISNNVVQGTPASTDCMVVLRPDGLPADGRGNTPRSPVTGGGILGAGFGVAAVGEQVWLGNFGWGGVNPDPGSISIFDRSGQPLTPDTGLTDGLDRVQGIATDRAGNVWAASYGNQRVAVYLDGDPQRPVFFDTGSSDPFDIERGRGGDMWVSYSNTGEVAKLRLTDAGVELVGTATVGKQPKGFAVDRQGNAWVSTVTEDAVYRVSRDLTRVTTHGGGGIAGTWGATVDAENRVWLANFAPGASGQYAVSVLCAGPPCGRVGKPVSPATGYTLPSAGAQVRLSNGDPLYGPGEPPSYKPLMRQTSVKVDSAGNLWVTNNWKPSKLADVSNPGGDGVVVFLGVATPN